MSEDRLYAVRLLWVRDPDLFAQYQEMTKPILARHGVHIERWLMTDAIEGEGMEKPDEVVVTWFTSSDARRAFETDPEFVCYVGVWFSLAGDPERALSLIEKAVRMGFFCYPWTMRDSLLDPLRTTAEFQTLLAHVEARHQSALAAFTQAGGYEVLGLTPSASSSSS